MNKICDHCGKHFKGRRERRFCSRACVHAARVVPKITITCDFSGCDNPIVTPATPFPSVPSKHRYCSRECFFAARVERPHTVILICENCDESFCVPYKKRHRRFCSRDCWCASVHNPHRTRGHQPYYGKNWREQRTRARKRDKETCRACGKTPQRKGGLQVHHRTPFEDFPSYREANRLDNLVTLCLSCHRLVHYGKIPCPASREAV